VAEWTALNATSVVPASTASARRDSGAEVTVTPRWAWASHGNRLEVNSSSLTSTRARSGSAAATRPSCSDTVEPTATSASSAPTSRANAAREPAT
jgi:hypothetical protein